MLKKFGITADAFKEFIYASVAAVFFIVYFGSTNSLYHLFGLSKASVVLIGVLLICFIAIASICRIAFRYGFLRAQLPIHLNIVTILGVSYLSNVLVFVLVYLFHIQGGATTIYSPILIGAGISSIIVKILILYLLFFWLTFFSHSVGETISKNIGLRGEMRIQFFTNIGLGFFVTMLCYFILALLHQLTLGPVILLALTIYFVAARWHELKEFLTKRRTLILSPMLSNVHAMVSLIAVSLIFLSPLLILKYYTYPSLSLDDWQSYLNIPLTFLEHNGLVAFLTPANQLPYISTYLLLPLMQVFLPAVSLFNGYLLYLTAALIAVLAIKNLTPRAAAWSVVLFLTLLINNFILSSVRPDGLLVFLIVLSVALALETDNNNDRRLLALSGLFLGVATAVKYNALLLLPALAILVLTQQKAIAEKLRSLVIILIFAILAFAPWGLYNSVVYQNPLHPFFAMNQRNNLYNGLAIQEARRQYYAEFLAANDLPVNIRQNAIEKIVMPSLVSKGWPTNHLGPIVLLVLLAVALKKTNRFAGRFLVASLATYVAWHLSQASQLHYIDFIYPIFAMLLAYYLDQFKRPIIAHIIIFLLIISYVQILYAFQMKNAAFMLANDQHYRNEQRSLKHFAIAKSIDTLKESDADYVVFNITGKATEPFYPDIEDNYRHVYVNNLDWFDYVARSPTITDLIAEFRNNGFTHIAIPEVLPYADQIKRSLEKYPMLDYLNSRLEELVNALPLVVDDEYIKIYSF